MERYRFEAREGLDLYTPEDRHDAYRTLGSKVIALPDGTIEVTGDALPVDRCGDAARSTPNESSASFLPSRSAISTPHLRAASSRKSSI